MMRSHPARALGHVRTVFDAGTAASQTDARLLEQFSSGHREAAEAAFSVLIERHGAMVLRVCRGVLGNSHQVHDAFQATFLVLVRKAGTLWAGDSIGPWLHGVAVRVACKARVAEARRKAREHRYASSTQTSATVPPDELAPALQEEIARLPGKYRAPIILCYFEGMTHEAAAHTLGWPVGTVRGRMARGRELLRNRLARRGLAPTAGALAAALTAENANATALSEPYIRGLSAFVAERSASLATPAVDALSRDYLRTMTLARLGKIAAGALLAITLLGAAGMFWPAKPRSDGDKGGAARNASPRVAASQPSSRQPVQWPADTEVTGRVVDHRGNAVAGADVLLLGEEQLTVYARPGREEGRFLYSLATRPDVPRAPSKTDASGRFALRRSGSPATRLAIVAGDMLLWEITRAQAGDANPLVVTLPEPAALTIHAEIPDKPAKLEFALVGRLLSRVDWESDSVFLRDVPVPNPGEATIQPLPPGQYAVERYNFTPSGKNSQLLTPSERKILRIEAGKRAPLSFDRATGRRVEGQVRGIDGAKFRTANVTISYLGPEELLRPGDKPRRTFTGFDVIPVGPDGRFTTPPLPPNHYELRFDAFLGSTPDTDGQPDYAGSTRVDVLASGVVAPVEISAKRNKPVSPPSSAPSLKIEGRDEMGGIVPDFEVELRSPGSATLSVSAADGSAVFPAQALKAWTGGTLVVHATGFASVSQELDAVTAPRTIDVTLVRGTRVKLRVRDAEGKTLPPAVMPLPLVYLAPQRREARQALAIADAAVRARQIEQMNVLNVRRDEDGDFVFHIRNDESKPLYFGLSDPESLLHFERGPIPVAQLASGVWDITLPEPATVEVSLKVPRSADGNPLFESASYVLTPGGLDRTSGVPVLQSGRILAPSWNTELKRLAPGSYEMRIQTVPRGKDPGPPQLEADPGQYVDMRKIDVKAGEHLQMTFDPPAFNTNAWQGTKHVTVFIKGVDDRKSVGAPYTVWYDLAHYGRIRVAEGTLPANGRIPLDNVAASGNDDFGGNYSVDVGGEFVGTFRVTDQPDPQEIVLAMPVNVGDMAPDGRAIDVATGNAVRIVNFRGRYVFLEFWASWCGPCQEPMRKLAALAKRRRKDWENDVSLVAISIDNDREEMSAFMKRHDLSTLTTLWSPREGQAQPTTACADYSVHAVPTAFLIGPDGRILWRGHPAALDLEAKIESLRAEHRARSQ